MAIQNCNYNLCIHGDLPQFCYDRYYSNDNASVDNPSELNIEEYHGQGVCFLFVYMCRFRGI